MKSERAGIGEEEGHDGARGWGTHDAVRAIHRRRPFLTALFIIAAPVHTLLSANRPTDLLDPEPRLDFVLPWALVFLGVAIRLWGSGNLQKNQEITDSGIYRMVRHPLYLGTLLFLLAYFLTVGDAIIGLLLFVGLVIFVYYPTMLSEEEHLRGKFPEQFARYRPPPRLLPDLRRLPEALDTDRFSLRAAYRNLGLRSLWFILILPLFLRLLGWTQTLLSG